ncbi:MAG: sugar transferase, partial [Bianqueaceae bacterium]
GFTNRLMVKPGLTGLAQVNGGYDISPEEKLRYDLEYIWNQNVFLDVKILMQTVWVTLTGKGAR